jgi:hypothetical protein
MTEHYEVVTPQPLLDRIKEWAAEARSAGYGPEFLTALKLMNQRLENDPDSWGDPLFDYAILQGAQCRGMIPGWFLVWYGVHPPSRSVLVREIAFAPGCPIN